MGRHTKDVEHDAPADDDRRRSRGGGGRLPLLPAVSGVVMVGVVVSALSTKQIALNFAGGPPPPTAGTPQVTDSPVPEGKHSSRTARDDSSLSPRSGVRASRGADRGAVSVAFRTLSRSTAGFQGQVSITNHSRTPVRGWTLSFRYPGSKILSIWDARVVRTGTILIVRNPVDRPSILPGRTVRLSFTAVGTGTPRPSCRFNGGAC